MTRFTFTDRRIQVATAKLHGFEVRITLEDLLQDTPNPGEKQIRRRGGVGENSRPHTWLVEVSNDLDRTEATVAELRGLATSEDKARRMAGKVAGMLAQLALIADSNDRDLHREDGADPESLGFDEDVEVGALE